jgi:hypothetical protein
VTLTQSGGTTLTVDCSLGSFFLVELTSSTNFSLTATNVTTGQYVTMLLNVSNGAFFPQIAFGANIRESTFGAMTITSGRQATVSFIGYDGYLVEVARVATLNLA